MFDQKLKTWTAFTVTPDGSIEKLIWKRSVQRKMMLPNAPIHKIPNKPWQKYAFPYDPWEQAFADCDVKTTFNVYVPDYGENLQGKIAEKLQAIIYGHEQMAFKHKKAASINILKKISKTKPRLVLGGELTSICNNVHDFEDAIRFTNWSTLPTELIQTRVKWECAGEDSRREIQMDFDLLFDQRAIVQDRYFSMDRWGRLWFPISEWKSDFDLEKVQNWEIPELQKILTPPTDGSITIPSSSSTVSISAVKRDRLEPKRKRIRLENRFAISTDSDS